jgi:hypothetical protein
VRRTSTVATTAVTRVCIFRFGKAVSSAVSAAAGEPTTDWAIARSMPRVWDIVAAAGASWPATSPMTSIVVPSGTSKASYQSPPTWAYRVAGR